MSIEMMIYLIGAMDQVGTFLIMLTIPLLLGGSVCLICSLYASSDGDEDASRLLLKAGVITLSTAIVFGAVNTALPSSKTATMMAAAHLGKDALASETGQKLKKVLDAKLDELVAEVEKKGK